MRTRSAEMRGGAGLVMDGMNGRNGKPPMSAAAFFHDDRHAADGYGT